MCVALGPVDHYRIFINTVKLIWSLVSYLLDTWCMTTAWEL